MTLTFGETSVEARTANLSLGGMHLVGESQPPFGTAVTVSFRLPTLKEDTTCKGVVRWNRPDGFGVQIEGLRAIDTWGMNQYFKQLAQG